MSTVRAWQVGFYSGGVLKIRGRTPLPVDTIIPPTGAGLGLAPLGTGPLGQ